MRRFRFLAALAAAVPCLAGCANLRDSEAKPLAKAGGPQRVEWNGTALGEPGKASVTPEAFGNRVAVLLKANRQFSARQYVERYPDVALAFLHSPPAESAGEIQAFVERTHEAQCANGRDSAWSERIRFTSMVNAVVAEPANVIQLCSANQKGGAALDADRLAGQTHLKANHPKDAAKAFEASLAAAANRPYEAVELRMLYAESLRREGQVVPAAAEWTKAVELAAHLLLSPSPVNDPHQWEELAANRPVDAEWPAALKPTLLRATAAAGLPLQEPITIEGAVWAMIGCWRIDRNEYDAALKSLKRAETVTADLTTRNLLQVWQAKALVLAAQVSTATTLLVPLVEHPSPLVAGPAGAHLAAIKLQGGAVRQARTLLEHSLSLPGEWAGRTDAEADAALVLIIDGEDAKGLAQLHAAQNRFAAAGDLPGLLRCLRNEADYWTTKDNKESRAKEAEVRKRIESIEMNGSLDHTIRS